MTDITKADWDAVTQEREEAAPQTPPAEQPPVEEQQSEQAPEQQSTEPAEQPQYAQLDPEVQAKLKRLDELTAVMPQLVNELKATQGRVGALQSQWDKAKQNVQAPSQTQVAAAAKDPEKWEALKKDFPEWGDAISEFVETKLGAVQKAPGGPTQEEIEQLVAQRTEAATATIRKQLSEALVTAAHRNWKSEVKTDGFKAWFQTQPEDVRALAESSAPEDAIHMLDLYAEAKAKPATKVVETRTQRLAAAATTTKPGGSAPSVSKRFEDMTAKEQWEYLARERERAGS